MLSVSTQHKFIKNNFISPRWGPVGIFTAVWQQYQPRCDPGSGWSTPRHGCRGPVPIQQFGQLCSEGLFVRLSWKDWNPFSRSQVVSTSVMSPGIGGIDGESFGVQSGGPKLIPDLYISVWRFWGLIIPNLVENGRDYWAQISWCMSHEPPCSEYRFLGLPAPVSLPRCPGCTQVWKGTVPHTLISIVSMKYFSFLRGKFVAPSSTVLFICYPLPHLISLRGGGCKKWKSSTLYRYLDLSCSF